MKSQNGSNYNKRKMGERNRREEQGQQQQLTATAEACEACSYNDLSY